jgi:hypothetical protein
MSKKPLPGDLELERYLKRVMEDDNDVDAMLLRRVWYGNYGYVRLG